MSKSLLCGNSCVKYIFDTYHIENVAIIDVKDVNK